MRTIDVGILRAPQIRFDLIGDFDSSVGFCASENVVSIENGRLMYNGVCYDSVEFAPCDENSLFALHDVVIGVNFHWQRKELQKFKGWLVLFVEEGAVRAVNRIDVEDYLVSVISSEMSAASSLEFLKAHAIVSRSWLYAQLSRKEKVQCGKLGYENCNEIMRWYAREDHSLFDFCADDHCQRYQGVTRAENPNVAKAVKATEGLVLKYDGKVCDARFSKCCGGVTELFSSCWENSDFPYLKAVRDYAENELVPDLTTEEGARCWIESSPSSFCSTEDRRVLTQILNGYDRETNDYYRWRVEYSQKELSMLVAERSGIDFGTIEDLFPIERGPSGRIIKLRIIGSKASLVVGKELEIRRWLSKSHLYSSAFVVDKVIDKADGRILFVIKGAGWGHGVGLCQIGAAMMGEQGACHEEILAHYYPGAVVESV